MNSLWIEGEGGGEVCPGGDGAKGGARDWRMAEVKNGREKEMWCSVGRAASSSVSSLIHLPASAPPLQGSFSSSSLSLPLSLLHMFFPLLFVLILFYVSLSMENTAPFADLVLLQCCPSRVKIRLFFQMFSGILFALWLLSLIIFFYCQFSSCSCSDFASQALHFLTPAFFLFFGGFFLTPAVVFAASHHAVLPPDVCLSSHRPARWPAPLHQKRMMTLEEMESLSHILQSATGKH